MAAKPSDAIIVVEQGDVPASWQRATVQELLAGGDLELVQDGNHGGNYPKASEFSDAGIPLITGADINAGEINLRECKFLKPESAERLRIGFAKPGDVLLTHKGTMGKTAIVPQLTTPYVILNPQLTLYRTSPHSRVDSRFLKYFFDSPVFQSFLHRVSGISTISTLSLTVQKSLELRFPDLSEQAAITRILGALDDKIELNRRMNGILEGMARAIFKAWFVDFEPVKAKAAGASTFPGMPQPVFDRLPNCLVDSELGQIPKGWEVGNLGEVMRHPRRSARPDELEPTTPYVGLEHIQRQAIWLPDWGEVGSVTSNKHRFSKGEFLFGKLRPYFHKVCIAPVGGVCSTDVVVVAPSSPEWAAFVLFHISSRSFVAYATSGSTGTKMPRTNWKYMCAYPTTIPPEDVAKAYNDCVAANLTLLDSNVHEERVLASVKHTLLPRLISGELTIPASNGGGDG